MSTRTRRPPKAAAPGGSGTGPRAAPSSRAADSAANVAEMALELFLADGFDATPMSAVAAKAGLTKAGVYHHFESKEHLLYVVHQRHIERQLLPMIEAAAAVADPEARLRRFLGDYATLLTRDPSLRLLINETRRLAPAHAEAIRESWRGGLHLVRDAVTELIREGRAREGLQPTYAAFAALGMCSWICNWFDYQRPESGPEVARTMVELFLGGLLRPGAA